MVVPVCYAFDGNHFYTPIDEKPKSVAAGDLKRVRNIKANSRVALVIDHYSEDWSELKFEIRVPRNSSPFPLLTPVQVLAAQISSGIGAW